MNARDGMTPRVVEGLTLRPLSDAAVDEQTASLAAPIEAERGDRVSLLVFQAGGERFALPAAAVERIILPVPVRRVPHRNRPSFLGLIAHEGDIVPAGSLERLLDLHPAAEGVASVRRVVVLGPAGRGWAFEVEAVEGVVSVPDAALRPAAITVSRSRGTATRLLVNVDGRDVAVLDANALRAGWEAAAA